MGKYIWAIAQKQDSLWMRWIHSVYLKDRDWWSYKASDHCSWYWRSLVNLKEHFKGKAGQQLFTQHYQIEEGYKVLCPTQNKVYWSRQVWGRLNTPKHCFIMWLAIQKRLRTKDRLKAMGLATREHCEMCESHSENTDHLFFTCRFTAACLQGIKTWLSWNIAAGYLLALTRWIGRSKLSNFKKNVLAAAISCLVYTIWRARNLFVWENSKSDVEKVITRVKQVVTYRINAVWPRKVSVEDTEWFQSL
uniref:Reverse transcriptase zinc-binding domain-containing protein n=1 Tax=Cannabis sativa TaxID=3483 RepID=A0A803PI47_CANSA